MQLTGRLTGSDNADILNLFSESTIWRTVNFATSFLLYLPGMILINLFINEVNFKTHRQNIIDGWKRETFIFTKVGLVVCIAIAVTLMNMVAAFMMCKITDIPFSITAGAQTLLITFIQAFVYMAFALLLATLFRKSGIAIIVFFVYGLLLEILFMLLIWKFTPPWGLQHFLPLQVADSMIPVINDKNDSPFANNPGLTIMMPAAIIFGLLYVFFTVRKYKYDDL